MRRPSAPLTRHYQSIPLQKVSRRAGSRKKISQVGVPFPNNSKQLPGTPVWVVFAKLVKLILSSRRDHMRASVRSTASVRHRWQTPLLEAF
jgi:hypothetical protein